MNSANEDSIICGSCSKQIFGLASFCPHCGQPIFMGVQHEPTIHKFPEVGVPIKIYKKAKKIFHTCNTDSSSPIDWLNDSVDLVFTDLYFVIISSAPQTALKEYADKMVPGLPGGLAALGGGVGGAILGFGAALTLGTAGLISESIFGNKNSLDQDSLSKFFTLGLVIYARKKTLRFHLSARKRAFIYTDHSVGVTGLFWLQGNQLDLSINFSEDVLRDGGIKKLFQQGKCDLIEVK